MEQNTETTFEQLYNQLVLKIDANGRIGLFRLHGDETGTEILIKADNIKLEGLITANGNFKILEDGSIETTNAKFSGRVEGSFITGSQIEVYGESDYFKSSSWDNETYGVSYNELFIQDGVLKCLRTTYASGGFSYTEGGELSYNNLTIDTVNAQNVKTQILGVSDAPVSLMYFTRLQNTNGYLQIDNGDDNPFIFVNSIYGGVLIRNGDVSCATLSVNGSAPITVSTKNNYSYPPANHSHGEYASSSHYQPSTTITPVQTGGGNVGLSGLNVASVNWCNATFQPISSSDLRLKMGIVSLDDRVDAFLII